MEVKTLAQLSKIADVCRKKGIESIKITTEAVEFTLKEDLPTRKRSKKSAIADNTEHGIDQTEMPSEEDILFWSAGSATETPTTGQE